MTNDLFALNHRGIFPLPEDTEESYVKKAILLSSHHQEGMDRACDTLDALYGIRPDYVPVAYSSDSLALWEAACTWMEEDRAWIQMRASFEKKEHLFFLYSKNEVLSHECVHAVRYPLACSKFEEFFAYFVSQESSRFRTLLGPLFETPQESRLLLFSLLLPFIPLLYTFFQQAEPPIWAELFLLPPIATLSFFTSRLVRRWQIWRRCKKNIEICLPCKPLHLMIRLLDQEIELFARLSPQGILEWINEEKKSSFRWQMLVSIYCK